MVYLLSIFFVKGANGVCNVNMDPSPLVKQFQYATTTTPPKKSPDSYCDLDQIKSSNSSRNSSLNLNLEDAIKLNSDLERFLSNSTNNTSNGQILNSIKCELEYENDNNELLYQPKQPQLQTVTSNTTSASAPPQSMMARNNIDYAIDAVLELCRQDCEELSRSEAEVLPKQPDLNDSEISETPVKSPPATNKKSPQLTQQQQKRLSRTDSELSGCEMSMPLQQQQLQSPVSIQSQSSHQQPLVTASMSKSTKARTSYISSLIANREKTSKPSSASDPHNNVGDDTKNGGNNTGYVDDRQKKISQNILSILASSTSASSSPINNTNNTSNSSIKTNSPTTNSSPNPVQIQPKQNQQLKSKSSPSTQQQPKQQTPQPFVNNTTSIPTSALSPNNLNHINKNNMDFILTNNKKLIQNPSQQQQQNNTVITTNNPKLTTSNTSDILTISSDCSNLKRLLSQPIDPTLNLQKPTTDDENINLSLTEPTFDRSLIKILIRNLDCDNNTSSLTSTSTETSKPNVSVATTKKKQPIKRAISAKPKPIVAATPQIRQTEGVTTPPVVELTKPIAAKRKRNTPAQSKKSKAPASTPTITLPIPVQPQPQPQLQPQPQQQPQQLIESNNTNNTNNTTIHHQQHIKPKKLKTIADIVKHQSIQHVTIAPDFNNGTLSPQQHLRLPIKQRSNEQPQQQQQQQHHLDNNKMVSNEDLTISWINHNTLLLNSQSLDDAHISSSYSSIGKTTNQESKNSDLNIEQLLELELNSNNHQNTSSHETSSSPIDKYIDLDDIDVNPLDCYRNNHNSSHHHHQQQQTGGNSNLDEFNLQFSVCSTSSSGFSEPSNFSSCSSICSSNGSSSNGGGGTNIYSNNLINGLSTCLFGDESSPYTHHYDHSPPIQYHQQQNMHNTSMSRQQQQQHSLSNDLLIENNASNNVNNASSSTSSTSSGNKMLDWNIIEFTTTTTNSSSNNASNSSTNATSNSSNNTGNSSSSIPSIKTLLNNCQQQFGASQYNNANNTSDLINTQSMVNGSGGGVNSNNCGENIFGGFNFFNDEIKLEI